MIATLTFIGPISAVIISVLYGINGWKGWRWLYLIFGCAGLGVAVLGVLLLPDYPGEGKITSRFWVSGETMQVAGRRMREDRVGEKLVERRRLWTGCRDAVKDVRVWVFVSTFSLLFSWTSAWCCSLTILT